MALFGGGGGGTSGGGGTGRVSRVGQQIRRRSRFASSPAGFQRYLEQLLPIFRELVMPDVARGEADLGRSLARSGLQNAGNIQGALQAAVRSAPRLAALRLAIPEAGRIQQLRVAQELGSPIPPASPTFHDEGAKIIGDIASAYAAFLGAGAGTLGEGKNAGFTSAGGGGFGGGGGANVFSQAGGYQLRDLDEYRNIQF